MLPEVGMYCRTYKGIAKIIDKITRRNDIRQINEERFILDNGVDLFYQWHDDEDKEKVKKEWIKSLNHYSYNIVDLIEVEDVLQVEIMPNQIEKYEVEEFEKYNFNGIKEKYLGIWEKQRPQELLFIKEHIKTILTKEQYDANKYVI